MQLATLMGITKAGIDIELLVWLVVVGFTLVSQMARAVKQKPGQKPPAPRRPGEAIPAARRTPVGQRPSQSIAPPRTPRVPAPVSDAQKELEDFLATLAGQPPPNRRPPEFVEEPEEQDFEPAYRQPVPPPPPPPPPMRRAATLPRPRVVPKPAAPMVIVNRETVRVDRPEPVITGDLMRDSSTQIGDPSVDPYGVAGLSAQNTQDMQEFRATLAHDLKSIAALRKAVVLREILDPPIALRQSRPIGC